MPEPVARELHVNGVTLHCETLGSGDAILGIHGTGSSALLWSDALPELSRRGRVVLYDRRGCGRSERPEPYLTTSVRQQSDDAAALLEMLGTGPAAVIGRSYGGEIAVDLAVRRPELVRALALLEPSIPLLAAESERWLREATGRFRATAAEAGPAAAAADFYRSVLGDAWWDGVPAVVREIVEDNGPAILAELSGEWSRPTADQLAAIAVPVVIVSAEDSPPAFRAADDALARMMPSARREVVPGGHAISPSCPEVLQLLDGPAGPA